MSIDVGTPESWFLRQVEPLPAETRRLLALAAADPVGEPLLLWRAADQLGIGPQAAEPAVDAGLFEIGAQVRFRHPCVRSAVYRAASPDERHELHGALAAATDPQLDPDRRAWHRAQATPGPDEEVAEELERSADRALARGGIAAAAAFRESAAMLTPEPARRGRRLLAAARAKREAGALDAAQELLVAVEAGPAGASEVAQVEQLRGQIAFDQRRMGEASRLLLSAARRLGPLDAAAARTIHLEAIGAAMWAGDLDDPGGMRVAAEAAHAAPPGAEPPGAVDLMLDGLATRLTDGYTAAAPILRRALETVLALEPAAGEVGHWLWLAGSRGAGAVAFELWDADAAHTLASRQAQVARDAGALVQLQFALNFRTRTHILGGDLAAAAAAIEEERKIAEATRRPAIAYTDMMLEAWRGREAPATECIAREQAEATRAGQGRIVNFADYATAVLNNGIGRYDAARDAARRAFERDHISYLAFVAPELAEAASRTEDAPLLQAALDRVSECARVTPTDWALGMEARVRALAGEGDAADASYRESIERLARTRARAELARSRLLYGEWLRREGRRVDAREQLRVARELLTSMGADGFGERARHELLATGEKVRKRRDDTRDELTPQEEHIARLARDGRTNPEIGAELFLSPRTVEWHLKKVFTKLGISSRRALRDALPREREAAIV
jgi:DNA-binding CsgD family transcriptional regulator